MISCLLDRHRGTPARIDFDADALEPDPIDTRPPAGGDEQLIAAERLAIVEIEEIVLALTPRGGC